jgi:predicted short-subunit dehydrogenase-like oxidoreductase (DUF2520 family)
MARTIAVVGPGRVGQTLARSLRRRGYRIGPVVGTNQRHARRAVQFIGSGKAHAQLDANLSSADVVLISTPDAQVAQVARTLSRLPVAWRRKVILHTSGALSSRELVPLGCKGAAIGSFHPLYPFPRPLREFPRGVAFGIEGHPRAEREARRLAHALGGEPIRIRPGEKGLYHAAAVLAAGHLMTLFDVGVRAMTRSGISRQKARRALLPLARATLEAYEQWGEKAWTGPVARADAKMLLRHLSTLRGVPGPGREVYAALARAGLKLYQPASGAAAKRLRRHLRTAK